jgi:hypothetical protein
MGSAAGLVIVVASLGCAETAPAGDGAWQPAAPEEVARAIAMLRGAELDDRDGQTFGGVPLQAVTALAMSPRGLVVGGVSSADDLFWDAWLVPDGGGPVRRLAPIGNNLIGADASGVLWTAIVGEDESGNAAYEVRLSPADGGPSVSLASDLPATFAAERALADDDGGHLLVGVERLEDGSRHASVFAVTTDGTVWRVAADPGSDSPFVLNAVRAPGALYVEILYGDDTVPTIVKVPRP